MTDTRALADLALEAIASGYAVMPPRADGSKRPAGDILPDDCDHPDCVKARGRGEGEAVHGWVHWQHAPVTETEIRRWYTNGTEGIGVICGQASGGLEMFEFEGRAITEEIHLALIERADQVGVGDLLDRVCAGYTEVTPSGGIHILWRCPGHIQGNQKLARRPSTPDELEADPQDKIKVLIETRGEGGYVIVAPTAGRVHPTGRGWELTAGSLATVETITPDEREQLLDLARSFDRLPRPIVGAPAPTSPRRPPPDGELRPGDDYNQRPDAADRTLQLLARHGWGETFRHGNQIHLRRPGKTAGTSAVLHTDPPPVLYVFTTSSTFESEQGYSPFAVYALLEHQGDHTAAAKALHADGYGTQRPAPQRNPIPNTEQPPPPTDEGDPAGQAPPIDAESDYLPLRKVNLADLMRQGVPEPRRIAEWLYAGGLTALNSEPGVGKTWLAIWLAHQVMLNGGDVLYLDEEGGPELVTERLVALGAHPDLIEQRLTYVPFPGRRWDDHDLKALAARVTNNTRLAVFDSLPDFLALAGRDEDRATQVTEWVNRVCGVLRRRDIAQLVLDHLPKPPTDGKAKRSRYSRGSGSKLAKADGTLLLEVAEEFDAERSGRLRLWKTKDRRGRLPLPSLTKPALILDVTIDAGRITITPVAEDDRPTWDGPTECMNAVLEILQATPGAEFSGHRLVDILKAHGRGFRKETVREAAERLAFEGRVSVRTGARNSRIYRWNETGQTQEEPLDDEQF